MINKILGNRGVHVRSRLIVYVMCVYIVFASVINIVHCTSPDEFMDELHDENHPEAKIIEGEVVDTGAVNSGGDKSLESVEKEDYEKYKESKKTGMGMYRQSIHDD
jgi:hypothetical protein